MFKRIKVKVKHKSKRVQLLNKIYGNSKCKTFLKKSLIRTWMHSQFFWPRLWSWLYAINLNLCVGLACVLWSGTLNPIQSFTFMEPRERVSTPV